MKTELITVIEKTIDVLENNIVDYNFMNPMSCNCGILAQQALGIDYYGLEKLIRSSSEPYNSGAWSISLSKCPLTGEPLSIVFAKLESIGCSRQDIMNLEELCIPGKIHVGLCDKKVNLIRYLKAWRDLLIEESQPEVKTEYKLVFSDQKVKQLINEKLILS